MNFSLRSPLTEILRGLLMVGMILLFVSTLTRALGPAGAGLELPGGIPGVSDTSQFKAIGTLTEVPPIPVEGPGSADATVTGPVTAAVEFNELTAAQRTVNVATSVATAVAWMLGLGLTYRLLGDVRERGPFTTSTVRRLWRLAALIAVGGTAIGMVHGVVDASLIQSSHLTDVFAVEYRLTLLPLIGGATVALMALLVREGVTGVTGIEERA